MRSTVTILALLSVAPTVADECVELWYVERDLCWWTTVDHSAYGEASAACQQACLENPDCFAIQWHAYGSEGWCDTCTGGITLDAWAQTSGDAHVMSVECIAGAPTPAPTMTPAPSVTAVPTSDFCCPEEFTDCGTFCDYNSDCIGDHWCGDGSWNLCGDDYNYDYDWDCIICSFDKSWYHTHSCPPGYNDCGWGCDLDSDCSAYNEHTGHDNEQYSGLAQVAYSCDSLPDGNDGYYYHGDDGWGEDCSQDWCSSAGDDCWAGSEDEPCSCSHGKAKVIYDDGGEYVMYTCCTDGSGTDGEECNDCCTDHGLIILIIVLSIVGFALFATAVGIAICYFAKCACFAPQPAPMQQQQGLQTMQQPGIQMAPMAQAMPMPVQQGVIQTGVIQQPGVQQGTIVSAEPTKTNFSL